MDLMWFLASYLAGQARDRARALLARGGDRGALSLEWIVIAVLLVAAATAAGAFFKSAISAESAKLP